jgi:hypothetical protein
MHAAPAALLLLLVLLMLMLQAHCKGYWCAGGADAG